MESNAVLTLSSRKQLVFLILIYLVVKVCQIEKLKVADSFVNKRRYYPDFQIFINRINEKITKEEVKNYFEKFGQVEAVQITEGHGQLNDSKIVNRHCYIKFRN